MPNWKMLNSVSLSILREIKKNIIIDLYFLSISLVMQLHHVFLLYHLLPAVQLKHWPGIKHFSR